MGSGERWCSGRYGGEVGVVEGMVVMVCGGVVML